ncbi:hypothetical protein GCM10010452_41490 [Crossiella cryophila]
MRQLLGAAITTLAAASSVLLLDSPASAATASSWGLRCVPGGIEVQLDLTGFNEGNRLEVAYKKAKATGSGQVVLRENFNYWISRKFEVKPGALNEIYSFSLSVQSKGRDTPMVWEKRVGPCEQPPPPPTTTPMTTTPATTTTTIPATTAPASSTTTAKETSKPAAPAPKPEPGTKPTDQEVKKNGLANTGANPIMMLGLAGGLLAGGGGILFTLRQSRRRSGSA